MPPKEHILLVEDNTDTRDSMALLLEMEGYTVVGAANGQEALDHLASDRPSLILLDLMMPVLDGWGFRARQMLNPAIADIPVVILSAAVAGEEDAKRLGTKGFLQKPIQVEALLNVAKRYA